MNAPICDFCSAPRPVVQFIAEDFESIRGVAMSQGNWYACAPCKQLVENYRWDELADRCLDSPFGDWTEMMAACGEREELKSFLVAMYQEMALNMNGHTQEVQYESV